MRLHSLFVRKVGEDAGFWERLLMREMFQAYFPHLYCRRMADAGRDWPCRSAL